MLFALFVLLPLLSAAGFVQMTRAVLAASAGVPVPDSTLVAHHTALDAQRHYLLVVYLSMIFSAFVAGQLRNWLKRHGPRERSLDA